MLNANDVRELTNRLKPLTFNIDNDEQQVKTPLVQKYLNHYKINFSQSISGVRQGIGTFEADQFTIAVQYWIPTLSRGTIFIVHGYFDHVGLFHHLIRFALQNEFAVVAYDMPGMGLSSGEPAVIDSFDQYYTVLQQCVKLFRKTAPQPWCCIAQSAGSTAVIKTLLEQNVQPFEKVVLLAPLIRSCGWKRDRWFYAFGRFFIRSLPRVFTDNSHDQDFLTFLRKSDPLQHRRLPVKWVGAMKVWMDKFAKYQPKSNKLLIIQGDHDATVDWEYNIAAIKEKLPNARIKMIPQARHHLVAESAPYRAQVFAAIKSYWDKQ